MSGSPTTAEPQMGSSGSAGDPALLPPRRETQAWQGELSGVGPQSQSNLHLAVALGTTLRVRGRCCGPYRDEFKEQDPGGSGILSTLLRDLLDLVKKCVATIVLQLLTRKYRSCEARKVDPVMGGSMV